jgi:biotin carboxyl carrier protein
MEFEFLVDGARGRIVIDVRDGKIVFGDESPAGKAEVRRISANEITVTCGGRTSRIHLVGDGDRTFVSVDGREFVVTEALPGAVGSFDADGLTPEGSLRVRAPMPGKVIKIGVREGEKVRKNQTLAIVEAMKMENEIQTSIDGVVRKVHVSVGDVVDADRILAEIEPKET